MKDCYERRITSYPWIPSKFQKGDLFNKCHGPSRHIELCKANGISSDSIEILDEKANPWEFDKWLSECVAEANANKERIKARLNANNPRNIPCGEGVKICVKQHYFEEVIKEDQECYERYEDMCNAYNMEFY
jgi:hypothetical protein